MLLSDDDIVDRVCYSTWRRYKQWVDRADLKQECYTWIAANPERKPEWLWGDLTRHLDRYCRQEKATKSGYKIQDEYVYGRALICSLLPLALDPEGGVLGGRSDELGVQVARGGHPWGDLAALLADVRYALAQLGARDRNLLTARYLHQLTHTEIAAMSGSWLTEDAVRTRVRRAIVRLQRVLHSYRRLKGWGDV